MAETAPDLEGGAAEGRRCEGCVDTPCAGGCPAGVDASLQARLVSTGDMRAAAESLLSANPLCLTCGYLCHQPAPCEEKCILSDSEVGSQRIRRLHLLVLSSLPSSGVHAKLPASAIVSEAVSAAPVAVVGAGPAGLACASELARMGMRNVTVFEREMVTGGTPALEVPSFRLPGSVSTWESMLVSDLGVKFQMGKSVGSVGELRQLGHEAVFLGTGRMKSRPIPELVPGSAGGRVLTSRDFLRAVSRAEKVELFGEDQRGPLPALFGHVTVIGAGEAAIDTARAALRCGARCVTLVFRRDWSHMRCPTASLARLRQEAEEVSSRDRDGVVIDLQSHARPVGLEVKNGVLTGLKLQSTRTGQTSSPPYLMDCDWIIAALGSLPEEDGVANDGLETDQASACIKVSGGMRTSMDGVFAGGDAVAGRSSIVEAVGDGRNAAWTIVLYLCTKKGLAPPVRHDLPCTLAWEESGITAMSLSPLSALAARDKQRVSRVTHNPVAEPVAVGPLVQFTWNGRMLEGHENEPVSSALIAAGIDVFGNHPRDGSPMGLFCANGRCNACRVLVDGQAVRGCVEPLRFGMKIGPLGGDGSPAQLRDPITDLQPEGPPQEVEVLIIGGGPGGMAAALQLGKEGVSVHLVDSNDRLGGKLILQTHKFFGSVEDCSAGSRGMKIASSMADTIGTLPSVRLSLRTTAVGAYSDGVVGLLCTPGPHEEGGDVFYSVKPHCVLVATGSWERMLPFPGSTLPGVMGAGAFQTLVNRDWVRPGARVVIVGGGNVGLIAGYHAIQAGIEVVALVEAAPKCGGYLVHENKLRRLGVPVLTRHTIVAAHGTERVDSVTVAQVDEKWRAVSGTERRYATDCVLVAVGLSEASEITAKLREFNVTVFDAGDCAAIAEASAAMVTGRAASLRIIQFLGRAVAPSELAAMDAKAEIMSRPGGALRRPVPVLPAELEARAPPSGLGPLFHCRQEIPCDVCRHSCVRGVIALEADEICGVPQLSATPKRPCTGCGDCVGRCSGLAITLFDGRRDPANPIVTFPWELAPLEKRPVVVTAEDGEVLGEFIPEGWRRARGIESTTMLVRIRLPRAIALRAAGVAPVLEPAQPLAGAMSPHAADLEDVVVCRCHRVLSKEVRAAGQAGCSDLNHLKALTYLGMGPCGGHDCTSAAMRLLRRADRPAPVKAMRRPPFVEVPVSAFAAAQAPLCNPPSRFERLPHEEAMRTQQFDVVIVGAGSIGLPAAMAMAEAGLKVVVVEDHASSGQGDNKRAIGGVRATMSNVAKILVMRRSIEVFRTWQDVHGDDIDWVQGGYTFPVYEEKHEKMLKELLVRQRSAGLDISWIDRDRVMEIVPGIEKEGLRGGTHSPGDGSASPLGSAAAFQRHAEALGVVFRFREKAPAAVLPPLSIAWGSQSWYYAPCVLVAGGAQANGVLHTAGVQLPLFPDSHEAAITEPVELVTHSMVVDLREGVNSANFYFYQSRRNQVVFCLTPNPPIKGFDIDETSQFLPQGCRRLVQLLPRLASARVRRTWRGIYSNTGDGLPLVGWDEKVPGLLHACGMGGHGFMLGPGLGELLSRVLMSRRTGAHLSDEDNEILRSFCPHRVAQAGGEQLK